MDGPRITAPRQRTPNGNASVFSSGVPNQERQTRGPWDVLGLRDRLHDGTCPALRRLPLHDADQQPADARRPGRGAEVFPQARRGRGRDRARHRGECARLRRRSIHLGRKRRRRNHDLPHGDSIFPQRRGDAGRRLRRSLGRRVFRLVDPGQKHPEPEVLQNVRPWSRWADKPWQVRHLEVRRRHGGKGTARANPGL